ncbi:hypothetical protein BDP27DRAFT_1478292 [Rhodocollybia butyracea]|uniref:Uncharacterized protein n=1 Tax=Rhodocollybia butyracea TaxID=206335 RepID=A0A9P5PGM3_9AGAR|nr:hypothetical protein BDP27DRAFT_1478275 [Rhodocollybia butyracea]KAF9063518.1 hypothetical protein BDP27DRAFT_1478292 [Rhodocollybia butyracea]
MPTVPRSSPMSSGYYSGYSSGPDSPELHHSAKESSSDFFSSPLLDRSKNTASRENRVHRNTGPANLQEDFYQLKHKHKILQDSHSECLIALKIFKENYEKWLQSIRESPAHTPNPTTALLHVPSFNCTDFPATILWTLADYEKAKSERGNKGKGLNSYDDKLSSSSGLWFLQDQFANYLGDKVINSIRVDSKAVWQCLKKKSNGTLAASVAKKLKDGPAKFVPSKPISSLLAIAPATSISSAIDSASIEHPPMATFT